MDYCIYTSYFKIAAKDTRSLSICPKTPPWYLMGKAEDIMCSKELYVHYFKKFDISEEDFYEEYVRQTLSRLDPIKVLEKYRYRILLGWYAPGHFDCRHMFSRWIKEETGIIIPEADKEVLDSFIF